MFLVARFFPLFEASDAMTVVALIGGITAIFAASMGLVANDIKRVLAYSTVSQLGYMMFALGVGAYVPAMFHLFTHAWFKAGLFLASGSVNHASGTFNMQYMGGLRKYMPWTYWCMVICGISLVGLFPLIRLLEQGRNTWPRVVCRHRSRLRGPHPGPVDRIAHGLLHVPDDLS